jgi:hypothetical protein
VSVEEFALLLKAERRGQNWAAHCPCPSHKDQHPSLSIKAGFDGRVLVRCWGNCSTDAVLSAMGLTFKDLFPNKVSPQKLASLRAKHAANEARRLALIAEHARACEKVEMVQAVVSELGARLALMPECDDMSANFHHACNLLHAAQRSLDVLQTKF